MEFLIPSVKIIHIIISILLVLIILLQPSKSGDIGSMFGGGSSESVFGSSGAMPFLVKMTRLFGLIFVITSLFLGYSSVKSMSGSVVEKPPSEVFEEFSHPGEEPSEKSSEQVRAMQKADAEPASVSSPETSPAQGTPELKNSGEASEE